jgi:serine/threonine protein kinase
VWYALKCYPRRHRNARAIYGTAYHEAELAVCTLWGEVAYVDVVATPWIEGTTLDRLLGKPETNYGALSECFDAFALDILRKGCAHGDIKPENIVLTLEGELHLIDYDAAWLPGFEQSDMEEVGTPSFSHPGREERRFDKSIDDFSIALMSTMLAALALRRDIFEPHIDADNALFSPREVVAGSDNMLNKALSLFERKSDHRHYAIAYSLYACDGAIPNLAELLDTTIPIRRF